MKRVNYLDLLTQIKEINNPFSRHIFIGSIKPEYGQGESIWYDMGNGIAVSIRDFFVYEKTILTETSNVPGAVIIFNLEGAIPYVFKDQHEFIMKSNHFLLGLGSDDFQLEATFLPKIRYRTLTIGMKEELFLQLGHGINNVHEHMQKAKKFSYRLLQDGFINQQQKEILASFKDQKSFHDLLKNIFLESKTMDLTHCSLNRAAFLMNHSNEQTKYDKNRLHSLERAKELILNEYAKNLSIKEIAYKSAINECYLKKDFKAYYGMTILEMLQRRRLEVAKKLLQQNQSVQEVASNVGYKHAGHFSKLFTQYVGHSPSHFKKEYNAL
ncbi:helix-turn-helix transcriptional regulator [Candidatus Marinarcus aquaticus]|nr:AraC family transcriptional regulator [Candidatus Marinarcus aquaticus]